MQQSVRGKEQRNRLLLPYLVRTVEGCAGLRIALGVVVLLVDHEGVHDVAELTAAIRVITFTRAAAKKEKNNTINKKSNRT